MIEIIKYPEERNRKQFKCENCDTEWLADSADYDYSLGWYNVTCPICGKHLAYNSSLQNILWKEVNCPSFGVYDIYYLSKE